MSTFEQEQQSLHKANCIACLLSEAMKDGCKSCKFNAYLADRRKVLAKMDK